MSDQATIVGMIVAALRQSRPGLQQSVAQIAADTILQRLREAGVAPAQVGRDRIVLLPDGKLECMVCENQAPLLDAVPAEYLSDQAKRPRPVAGQHRQPTGPRRHCR
jgi:hypothetical protein